MEFGKILLTDQELSLVKKSNISLTEIGSSIEEFKDGFINPLECIKKAYSAKIQRIFVVVVETRDDHLFSITMAKNKNLGRQESITLSELINATIIKTINIKNMASFPNDSEIEPVSNKCEYCGEINDISWKFCKKCGKER
ncbi:MAG: hypothetical protein CEE42_08510 [Promethearchaeota archaeon Loki_b31]|nr:MAG: hypothetical protein CEE42_08510 [Candidatus Lokiarchaeota archaeon Loki_b31]